MYKESASSSVVKKPDENVKQFIINGIPEQGTSYRSQVDSDTKLIEEVLDHMAL